MSQNSYNNIKKYAAFIFMVFTVLSGSSDRIDSDSFARVSKKAIIDILATNRLFVQDVKASVNKAEFRLSTKDQDGFRGLMDVDMTVSNLRNIQVYTLALIVFGLFINNSIAKNNIWQSTVF